MNELSIEVKPVQVKISKAVKGWTPEEVAIIQKDIAKGTSPSELAYFLNVCKAHGLNPFLKEIWCYKDHKGNLIIFAGRQGLLTMAQRNPQYSGMRSCEVCENDQFSIDVANDQVIHTVTEMDPKKRGSIVGAYARCFRKDGEPSLAFVPIGDYDKGGRGPWTTHKADMIKKVAEVRVLKLAFGFAGVQNPYEWDVDSTGKTMPIRTEIAGFEYIGRIETLAESVLAGDELEDCLDELSRDIPRFRADQIWGYLKEKQSHDPLAQNVFSGSLYDEVKDYEKRHPEIKKEATKAVETINLDDVSAKIVEAEAKRELNLIQKMWACTDIEALDKLYNSIHKKSESITKEYKQIKKEING